MSSLENLVAKILADGEARAKAILADAEEQAAELRAQTLSQAQAEADRLIEQAHREADRSYERLVAERRLALRDAVLSAKSQMLDRVFAEALSRLNAMPREAFIDYLKEALSELDTDGEALLLPAKYGIDDLSELNAYLKSRGRRGNLVLSDDNRVIEGGFILQKEGIEQNNTARALIEFYRHRLEGELRNQLF